MREPTIRKVTQPPPADTAGTDIPWLPPSTLVPLSQADRDGHTRTPSSLQSQSSTHVTQDINQAAIPCFEDHKASVVTAVTAHSIPPTQEWDPKLRLLQTIPDQHRPGQDTYTQICQPAAVKCTHGSYTFPHK